MSNVTPPGPHTPSSLQAFGAKPKHLYKRGGIYYFKRKIPAAVAHGFPEFRGQVWKSLGTKLLHQARVYLAVEVTEFELKVAQLRKDLANDWAVAAGCLRPRDAMEHPHTGPRAQPNVLDMQMAGGTGVTDATAASRAMGFATPVGVTAAEQSSEMTNLTNVLSASARRTVAASISSVHTGGPRCGERPITVPAGAKATNSRGPRDPSVQLTTSTVQTGVKTPLLTMLHLFEDWKLKQTRSRTVAAVHTVVMDFRTLHGALAVPDITKAHVRAYRDQLIERRLSKGTIENRIGFLSTLVRHGMRELVEDLVRNPFERIDVVGAQGLRAPKDRRAFSVKELNVLFASRLYTQGYRPGGQAIDAAYWVPLLGPFVGARIEELCQLRLDDIQRVNGAWCIRICDLDEEQNVKTESSFRRVPLHDAVIQSGFLVYAANMAAAGHKRLFPTLSNHNTNRIYSNSVGKWFGRYLETIGLGDSRLDYHSFRYSFKQQCSLSGVSDEVREALSGHWVGSKDAGRAYLRGENRQYSYPKLVEGIRQLAYDELAMKHLFVGDSMSGVEKLLR
jgi:integrase